MEYKYRFAQLNIKITTDFEVNTDDFTKVFLNDFDESDVNINLRTGKPTISGKKIYSEKWFDIYLNENNQYKIIYKKIFDQKYIFKKLSECHLSIEQKGNDFYGIVDLQPNDNENNMYCLFGQVDLPHLLMEHNRVVLHASYIIHNGRAIIFSGKSGIGKTTQAKLWEKYAGAEIINGDKTILYLDNGTLMASSVPANGSSGICENKIAPVGAIVFLEHGEKNQIYEMSNSEKICKLSSNNVYDFWRRDDTLKLVEINSSFYDKTKIIGYSCLKDKSSVDFLRAVIE